MALRNICLGVDAAKKARKQAEAGSVARLSCCTMHTADFLKGLAQLPPHRCIIVFRQPREMIPPLHDLTKPQLLVDETDPAIDTQRLLTWVFFR